METVEMAETPGAQLMVIRYSDGSYIHAVIHRLQGGTVRAAVPGLEDAIEYRLIRGQWTSEMGVVVTFEFTPFQISPMGVPEQDMATPKQDMAIPTHDMATP